MRQLLRSNGFDGVDEVLDGSLEGFVWGWSWDGDGIVGHPPLCYALSLGGDVPYSVASVVTEAGTEVIAFSSMTGGCG